MDIVIAVLLFLILMTLIVGVILLSVFGQVVIEYVRLQLRKDLEE